MRPPPTFGPITSHSQRTLPLQLPCLLPVEDPPGSWVLPSKQAHSGVSRPGSTALRPSSSFPALLLTPPQKPCLHSLPPATHRGPSPWPIPVSRSPRTAGPALVQCPGAPWPFAICFSGTASLLSALSCWARSPVLASLTLPSLGSATTPRGLRPQPAGLTSVMSLRTQPLSSRHTLLQWAQPAL